MSTDLKNLLSLLDLTSLNDDDNPEHIQKVCEQIAIDGTHVAAVCVYPTFVAQVEKLVPKDVGIATVVNFPEAQDSEETVLQQTLQALHDGANEIDLVLPYHHVQNGKYEQALSMVQTVKKACQRNDALLKVIIESGAYQMPEEVAKATEIAIDGGANFVKTSTGKIPVGATLEAVDIICQTIARKGVASQVGIKISGGVRTVSDAESYLHIIQSYFGEQWIQPAYVRIGASSLLNDIKQALAEAK